MKRLCGAALVVALSWPVVGPTAAADPGTVASDSVPTDSIPTDSVPTDSVAATDTGSTADVDPTAHTDPTAGTDPTTGSRAEAAASAVDARWILRSQTAEGAIALGPDQATIWPYLANYAALGLARSAAGPGGRRYAAAAGRWLAWYQDHQDPAGVVWEQTVTPDGVSRPTYEVDAVDASAGTYLLAVEAWWQATGDRPALLALSPSVRRAVDAIRRLQDDDGLTWATATYRVKYLMDQAEAFAGLEAAARLAKPLGDDDLGRRAEKGAERLREGVRGLWDEAAGGYRWAVHADGSRVAADWSALYPDALSQVWAVAFGLSDDDRDDRLMGRFVETHADWASPASAGWWVPVVWALADSGDFAAARQGLRRLTRATTTVGRAWPFNPADAGQLIEARDRIRREALDWSWW